nr:NRT1/ PTR FAMILY 4.2-like protein [Lupinus angustifolius]
MGLTFDLRDRTYKHKKDRPPSPEPEPTPANPSEPQPSEFHAQSSSSVVMPSNQMIMDELISLRGYITNQMDAFDSQNQKIQLELHRLSYKMSSMDVDDDSSEPES